MQMAFKGKFTLALLLCSLAMLACGGKSDKINSKIMTTENETQGKQNIDTATFGAGCFWCVEAVFQRLEGVLSVKSGYSGGAVKNPSYKEVCQGTTGHAEVCQITYDKSKISFDELLEVFWKTHDPTTLNRQGNDFGTQYRSAVFYHNGEQKQLAEKYKDEINKSGAYPGPVVTEITAFANFYPAEDYHQNYFNENGGEPYCRYVIQPKVEKFEKIFKNKMKH
jgi:peptide-methionine (S)-S-oxide reductase